MLKKENNFFKAKKRQLNTPGILVKKPVPIFRDNKKNFEANRPKSKNMINNNQNNFHTHLGFYLKQNNNQKKINLHNNNNINNLNMLLNKKNIHIKKDIFSEQKNNNKKIFLAHNFEGNKEINNNIIRFNNDLSKSQSQKKKGIEPNNQNLINKLKERNDLNKNKIKFQNKINIIRIEDKNNKNLNDIFPKIKKVSQMNGNLININKGNNLDKIIKSNDLKIMQNMNNKKKNIKIVFPNNKKNNLMNINNNNHNFNKNMRYILKNRPLIKEENQLININKNIFNYNENGLLFKLNINNNIINKPKKLVKSSEHYNLNKNDNNLAFRNIILNKNDFNEFNNKKISLNEEKISDTGLEKIIHLKDYFSREEMNSKIKEEMEDYILVKHPFLNIEKHNLSLFCIFDGHGGDFVAKYLKENFASNLHKNIKINFSLNFRNILKASIESIDKEFEKFREAENCGSTGTIVVLDNNFIYCANVGDSKCFYINNKNNAFQLTEDHHCSNQKEREELKKKGIMIFQNRVFGSLSLTRTFGDTELKKDGIECNPYIKKILVDKEEVKYIIIASDGIWDVVSKEKLEEFSKELKSGTSEEFCNNLVDYAMNNGSNDNISCIVLRF